jgi:hypothetical protein
LGLTGTTNLLRFSADYCYVTTTDDLIQLELMLNRFNRLIAELLRGTIVRTTFHPWEIELLLDMESCDIEPRKRQDILRRYQKAVQKQMETGPGPPMKLSEFLQERMTRRPSVA